MLVVLIARTLVQGLKYLFGLTDERTIKASVVLVSAILSYGYRVDVMASFGLSTPWAWLNLSVNVVVLAVLTWIGHDLLDFISKRK